MPSFADTVGNRHFDELDPGDEGTVRYACADADFTLRLYHLLNNWFDRFLPKHRFIVEKIESPTAVYVGIMRYNGLPIDRQLMEEKRKEADLKLGQLRYEIGFIIGDVPIGANASTAAFKRYLFDTLKLPKMKLTAKENDALGMEKEVTYHANQQNRGGSQAAQITECGRLREGVGRQGNHAPQPRRAGGLLYRINRREPGLGFRRRFR
jgi:hypothetical protein